MDGQFNIADMFKQQKIEPKPIVHFINSMGTSQYKQIQQVIEKICEYEKYDMPDESIGPMNQ